MPPAPMPVNGLRLAVPRRYFCDLLDDEVRARVRGSARAPARRRRAHRRHRDPRMPPTSPPIYLHIVLADAAAYHAATLETMPERYTPPVRLRLEMGRYVLAEDYVRALAGRDVLRARSRRGARRSTTRWCCRRCRFRRRRSARRSVKVGTATEPVRNVMLRLTQLFNVTGHPAISIARRPDGVRAAVRSPARRLPRADGCAPARGARLRALRDRADLRRARDASAAEYPAARPAAECPAAAPA